MTTQNSSNFGTGTSGQFLISNGAGVAPTFQTITPATGFSTVTLKTFTSGTSTYTPTSGMQYCIVECIGGGGGGGGTVGDAVLNGAGAGGGAGGYTRGVFSAATIGASQTVTVGSAGTAGSSAGGTGGTGGDTTVGALITANGGTGGGGTATAGSSGTATGGIGGGGSGGTFSLNGTNGGPAYFTSIVSVNGYGGTAPFSSGGGFSTPIVAAQSAIGQAATSVGCGGSGAVMFATNTARVGGVGGFGFVCITEFI